MTNKTENLTETLAKAIELTCEKISKQSHQIAELGKETRTGIDIHISFDLSDFDTCVWLPTVSVENSYYGVDCANIGDLLDIYYGEKSDRAKGDVKDDDQLPKLRSTD